METELASRERSETRVLAIGDAAGDSSLAEAGDRALVTGLVFFAIWTSALDREKDPFMLGDDENSLLQGLRGYIA